MGAKVLVTGGTGSFGKSFIARLLSSAVAEVRAMSRDEQKHVELRRRFADLRLKSYIGDVRDYDACIRACHGCTHVFHAAAMKHVDVVERIPWEGVLTNVMGTWNMLRAADATGVWRFVGISTDKAVEPINAYGMTKGLQEKLLTAHQSLQVEPMRVTAVRYGNVWSSNGSVVPFFRNLLETGATKLPITHPDMTRFILTLAQAVDLVLLAAQAPHGALLVPHLKALRIVDLADEMLVACGQQRGSYDIVGIRPGEKIHETLLSLDELRRATTYDTYHQVGMTYCNEALKPFTSEWADRMSAKEIGDMLWRAA